MKRESILNYMRPSLLRCANIISEMIETVVSIVDEHGVRMNYAGGTWDSEEVNIVRDVGSSTKAHGGIIAAALRSGETQVLLAPKSHPACGKCPNRTNCPDLAEIWTPINAGGRVLGVIGFSCETEAQVARIRENCTRYVAFIE